MNVNNFIQLLVVALIGVILIVPFAGVIGETQDTITTKTISNESITTYGEGKYYDEDLTLIWKVEGTTEVSESTVVINGVEIPAYLGGGIVPLVIGNEFMVFMHDYLPSNPITAIVVYNNGENYINTQYSVNNGDITITYDKSESTITFNVGSTTFTVNSDYCFAKAVSGDYILIRSAEFNDVVISQSAMDENLGGVIAVWSIQMTVNGITYTGRAVSDMHGSFGVVSASDVGTSSVPVELTINGLTPVENSTDLFTNGTPRLVWDIDGEEQTTVISNSFVLKEVTGHVHEGAMYDLLGLLPLIVAFGFLLMMVGAFLYTRYL